MKVRNDFVTNSSSSSFILARNGEMNEKQKTEILKYVEKEFFGKVVLSPQSTPEEIKSVFEDSYEFEDEEMQLQVKKMLKEGKSIHCDWVSFEECEYHYASIFEDIWEIMEKNGDGNFVTLEDDLSY